MVLYRFSLTALSGWCPKMVGQQCCTGDQIIFDHSITNAIGSTWSIGAMWQVGAAGALQAGRPAQGEVLSTKLQQKADKIPTSHMKSASLLNTCITSLSEQQKSPVFHLKLHLVVEGLPVQTKAALCRVGLNFVSEGNYAGPPAMRCDFSVDGQRALIGWDWNVLTAWGDVDMETTWAPAMAPGATELEIPIVFTGSWRTQRERYSADCVKFALLQICLKWNPRENADLPKRKIT